MGSLADLVAATAQNYVAVLERTCDLNKVALSSVFGGFVSSLTNLTTYNKTGFANSLYNVLKDAAKLALNFITNQLGLGRLRRLPVGAAGH